ncbi:MAG: aspartate 1-decarboxylase [Candidatus Aminicenantes bacterium]|nr:aspartate 1-decarboxylase [Candidatus Aminicenantes bacterium]
MLRSMYKSKIHRAVITETNLDYEGSITIDSRLMREADILPNERVHVLNLNNGSRCETYAIEGEEDSGVICVNGAAAHHSKVGNKVIIIAYALMSPEEAKTVKPKIILVDENNKIKKPL